MHTQAELEGHPDIHLTLTTPPGGLPLDHLVVHPCVQSADVSGPSPSGTAENSRKIRFSAPLETFTLCHYQVSCLPYLPIRGFYQMKVKVIVVVVGGGAYIHRYCEFGKRIKRRLAEAINEKGW